MNEYCELCGEIIPEKKRRRNGRFCSTACHKKNTHNEYIKTYPSHLASQLPTGTIGALHEIIVCGDLMTRGFDVFRALSPNCPCDLIAANKSNIFRVEVTTGYITKNGACSYPRRPRHYLFDWLAVVTHNEDIYYFSNGVLFTPEIDKG